MKKTDFDFCLFPQSGGFTGGVFMLIETQRLTIREMQKDDGIFFSAMAEDGSLNDCGFDRDCSQWMANWIVEVQDFTIRNNPNMDYLAYTICSKNENVVVGSVGCSYYDDLQEIGITYFIGAQYRNNGFAVEAVKAYTSFFFQHYDVKKMIATIRDANISSWKVIEKSGFKLVEKKMYKDINDAEKVLYRFYEMEKK